MEKKPIRLQRKRVAGYKMQDESKAANGLEAVSVTRPGKWGNPFTMGKLKTRQDVIDEYENMIYANESVYLSI